VKKVKILFVPAGSGGVRQLIIPRSLMIPGMLFLCSSIVVILWLMQDYMSLSVQKPKLIHIQKQASEKQREFSNLGLRLEEVGRQFQELLELDRKLRIAANLEEHRADESILAMGGSVPKSSPAPRHFEGERELKSDATQAQAVLDKDIDITSEQEGDGSRFSKTPHFASFLLLGQHPVKGFIRSSFGCRVSSGGETTGFNVGIDISTRAKAPVVAPFDGFVTSYGRDATQGWVLSLTHGHGLVTFYGQLEKIFVREGQYVKRGEKIGMVSQGNQKGPHLHFEIRLNDLAVNPLLYISNASAGSFASPVF
jgi:murein DD-endopeptidase MepM/ murein hydrolase activator NlpD